MPPNYKPYNQTAAVWVIYAETKDVEVYEPNQPIRKYGMGDTIDGGNVLPGFKLAVKDIFEG